MKKGGFTHEREWKSSIDKEIPMRNDKKTRENTKLER